jgi:predicted dehydrogenase/threonine dehydrogenase-like Zn-dependent dehydrogenase
MRHLFLEKGEVVVKEVCQPLLDDHAVLVSVYYSFISSGTEVATISNAQASLLSNIPDKIKKVLESVSSHGIEGTKALIKGKLKGQVQLLGYSCSGRVIAVGSKITKFRAGDFVACAGAGFANHADIVCVPENLVAKINDASILKSASITTIGAIALQGIRRAHLQLGETVCVLGLGLLGQITVQLAKLSGCTVIGIDLLQERLDAAKQLGADYVYCASDDMVQKEIEFLTQHYGVDVTLITAASKSDAIMQQAMEITRKKGKVVLVGDVGLNVSRDPFYKKEIDFLISCSYGPGRYDAQYEQKGQDYPFAYVRWTENRNMQAFVQLLEQRKLNIDILISQEISLDDIQDAYACIKEKQALGIVLCYGSKCEINSVDTQKKDLTHKDEIVQKKEFRFVPAQKDTLRVGFVGAGGFAKIKLMPIVSNIKAVTINAIVDADISTSLNACKLFGGARALVNDHDLFNDDLVDVVIIASPHKYHCEQALRALEHGKAVFLEKPMVTDFEQFERLRTFLDNHKQAPFCVDYNRSFAPFIQKIKKAIEKRHSPLMVHYRMNAGFISKEHWVQTDIGAGRIIGEACHIFDLFCYLTEAKPVSVSVEALHAATDDIFPTDNFSTQITFDDGSICSLLYTALGHAGLGKERMEIFYDSKSIVMDDYIKLQGYGLPHNFNEVTKHADKGHKNLISLFFNQLRQPQFTAPISLQRLNTAAQLTLMIDKLACEGGGSKQIE